MIRTSVAGTSRQMVNRSQATNLRKWLEGIVEAEWQSIDPPEFDRLAIVRGTEQFAIPVRQAKLIDVGMDLDNQPVVLSLAITINPDSSMNILVQLHPALGQSHLPPQLKLTMLSETSQILQEVCSREQDNYIQLRHFQGEAGDSFDIQVSLDNVSILESFVL